MVRGTGKKSFVWLIRERRRWQQPPALTLNEVTWLEGTAVWLHSLIWGIFEGPSTGYESQWGELGCTVNATSTVYNLRRKNIFFSICFLHFSYFAKRLHRSFEKDYLKQLMMMMMMMTKGAVLKMMICGKCVEKRCRPTKGTWPDFWDRGKVVKIPITRMITYICRWWCG